MYDVHSPVKSNFLPLLLLIVALFARPVGATTLAETLRSVLAEHPLLAAATFRERGISEELAASHSVYRPAVDLSLAIGQEFTDSPSTRQNPQYQEGDFVDLQRSEASVTIRQALFDRPRTREVKRLSSVLRASQEEYLQAEDGVIYDTIRIYLDVMSQRRMVETAQESLNAHQRILQQVKLLADSGAGSQTDVEQVEARTVLARVNFLQAQAAMRLSEHEFERVVGVRPPARMTNDLAIRINQRATEQDLLRQALHGHPSLTRSQYEIEGTQAEGEALRGRRLPTVGLEARLNRNENADGSEGVNQGYNLMLRMNYNLYNGGGDRALERSRAERYNEQMQRLQQSQRTVVEGVQRAWVNREIALEKRRFLQTQEEKSLAVRDAYRQQFMVGKRTLIEVLDSEKELQNARRDRIRGEFEVQVADVTLVHALGRVRGSVQGLD
jgi:outer membrane protein, adhesin transport system